MNFQNDTELRQKVMAKVPAGEDGECWEWGGATGTKDGYGRYRYRGREVAAHRAVYQALHAVNLHRSELVCHTCDNPGCVNPKHLFVGTHQDNMDDMVKKGRSACGSSHRDARLDEDDIDQIRGLAWYGIPTRAIADVFDVSPGHVRRIVTWGRWANPALRKAGLV